MIEWNKVTWYSKLAAAILFILVVPVWAFYIGMQYQKTIDIRAATKNLDTKDTYVPKKQKEFSIESHEARADDIRVVLSNGKTILVPFPDHSYVVEVKTVDINFDNYDDVAVSTEAGAYNIDTEFFAYNPTKGKFEVYDKFAIGDSLTGDVDFKPEAKTLKTFWKGRGIGDIFVENLFAFTNNDWQLVETISQDTIDSPPGSTDDYYLKTITTFENGKQSSEKKTYYKRVENGDTYSFVEVSESEATTGA